MRPKAFSLLASFALGLALPLVTAQTVSAQDAVNVLSAQSLPQAPRPVQVQNTGFRRQSSVDVEVQAIMQMLRDEGIDIDARMARARDLCRQQVMAQASAGGGDSGAGGSASGAMSASEIEDEIEKCAVVEEGVVYASAINEMNANRVNAFNDAMAEHNAQVAEAQRKQREYEQKLQGHSEKLAETQRKQEQFDRKQQEYERDLAAHRRLLAERGLDAQGNPLSAKAARAALAAAPQTTAQPRVQAAAPAPQPAAPAPVRVAQAEPEPQRPAPRPAVTQPVREPVQQQPAPGPVYREPAPTRVAQAPARQPQPQPVYQEPARQPITQPAYQEPAPTRVARAPVQQPAPRPTYQEPAPRSYEEPTTRSRVVQSPPARQANPSASSARTPGLSRGFGKRLSRREEDGFRDDVELAVNGATGRRIALVIGNERYTGAMGELSNPSNDASLITFTLRSLGFDVEVVRDGDQREMKEAIRRLGDRLATAGDNATGLFYYAGHGVQSGGQNFLIPVGSGIDAESDLELEAVRADAVLAQLEESYVSTRIVILDACRNMPLRRRTRNGQRGLAQMEMANGSFVAYSTSPGSTADDGGGFNSPFAEALAQQMVVPGRDIESVFREVRRQVVEVTSGDQLPWASSSLLDTFQFVPPQ